MAIQEKQKEKETYQTDGGHQFIYIAKGRGEKENGAVDENSNNVSHSPTRPKAKVTKQGQLSPYIPHISTIPQITF